MAILTQTEVEAKLRGEDLNTWLQLWQAEQGPAKLSSLQLMAAAIPFPDDKSLRVLDLCCGPGDAGRAAYTRFPNARIDFVDRDVFFASLCSAVNRRDGVPGQTLVRDLLTPDWRRDLSGDYDAVVVANALHWFSLPRAATLFAEIFGLLRGGGAFLFMEPSGPEPAFASGFNRWKNAQPSQHRHEDWTQFWSRVNTLLGCDYIKQHYDRVDQTRIADTLSVLGWIGLLKDAGFQSTDVLLRDVEKVVLIALKP
jgi:SAM-dependent methyltransferase